MLVCLKISKKSDSAIFALKAYDEFICYGVEEKGLIMKKNKCTIKLKNKKQTIYAMVVYDRCLYVGYSDGEIDAFIAREKIFSLNSHAPDGVCAFTIHNKLLYSGDTRGYIYVRNEYDEVLNMFTHTDDDQFTCLIIYNDLLYTGGYNGNVKVQDLNGECVKILDVFIYDIHCFIIYNNLLYVGCEYGNIYILDRNNNISHMICRYEYDINCLAVHNNLLYVGGKGYIDVFNEQNKCIHKIDMYNIEIVCFEIYNNLLYSADKNGNIIIWGEYWPCYYDKLPQSQKDKIQNLRQARLSIQKDLRFLFERELLF